MVNGGVPPSDLKNQKLKLWKVEPLTGPGDRESITFSGSARRETEGRNKRRKEDEQAQKDRHDKRVRG